MTDYSIIRAVVKWNYKRYDHRFFEFDELCNAVWCIGGVQKVEKKNKFQRARWDMQDYIRKETGFRTGKRYNSMIHLPNCTSLDTLDIDMLEQDLGYEAYIDHDEFLVWAFRQVSNTECEFQILSLMYRGGLPQCLVAKSIGVSSTRVSQIHSNLCLQLKTIIDPTLL